MRIAIISDIHGNATAFLEVLKNIDRSEVDHIFCLGDNIGYGPEPEAVIRMMSERNIPSVVGNHELAVNHPEYLGWFNPNARLSIEKTITLLSPSSIEYLALLPNTITRFDCLFVHGFPPDSPTLYLFEMSNGDILATLSRMTEKLCFIGHTHELVLLDYDGESVTRTALSKESRKLDPAHRYIVNVGSVGQPRDGNNDAKYVIWDDCRNELEIRFVPYNVTDTINKIYNAGLPEQHAWRLM